MNTSATENPVHKVQQDIAAAFAQPAETLVEPSHAATSFLARTLSFVGWVGTSRQAEEAKPYLVPVDDIAQLRATLHRLGFDTARLPLPPSRLGTAHLPCLIAPSDGGHPLLVVDLTSDTATVLATPIGTTHVVPLSSLDGDAWHVRPQESDDARQSGETSWVGRLLAFSGRGVAEALIVSCGINVLALAGALFAMAIYDYAIPSASFDTLALLAVGAGAAIYGELSLRRFRAGTISRLAARFDVLVSTATYAKILSLPLPLTENLALGTQLARLRQFRVGHGLFTGNVAGAILDMPFTVFSLSLLLVLGGSVAAVPIAVAALLAIVFLTAGPKISQRARQAADSRNRFDNLMVEIATKHQTIREAAMTEALANRAGELYRRHLVAKFNAQSLETTLQSWSQMIVGVAGIAVLGLGTLRVLDQAMSTGALIAMMAVVWRVMIPAQTLCMSLHRLQISFNTLRQIDQLMRLKSEGSDVAANIAPRVFSGSLQLKDVSLRYSGRADFALKGISLDVGRGMLVAVTGPSGSGKSALIKTALGLYQPQAGRISVDGLDLRQIEPREHRQATYYLAQDPVLFFGTIEQNVRLAAPSARDDDIIAALAAFGLTLPHPLLPDGLKTRIGGLVRSHNAAGLMQRIALASAFVQPRPLVFLDNPAQHLDADGDRALMAALAAAKRRSTIIMVTQRPSHMQLSDKVVVMARGEIVREGPATTILAKLRANPASTRAA